MRRAVMMGRLPAAVLVVLAAGGVLAVMASIGSAAKPPTMLATFSTPGTYMWTAPAKVKSVTFDVFGSRGGVVQADTQPYPTLISVGGGGGEATVSLSVTPGQVFEVVVGGQGGTAHDQTGGAGGFNGGGSGDSGGVFSNSTSPNTTFYGGGGGGGASDVRFNSSTSCVATLSCGLSDRFVVGGGGGGGGGDPAGTDGGAGGGLSGASGTDSSAATQSSGGTCDYPDGTASNGSFGLGGPGNAGGGGGGGGWYGGAGGCAGHIPPINPGDPSTGQGSSGGGGSGFISGHDISFPGGVSPSTSGDGYVKISTP